MFDVQADTELYGRKYKHIIGEGYINIVASPLAAVIQGGASRTIGIKTIKSFIYLKTTVGYFNHLNRYNIMLVSMYECIRPCLTMFCPQCSAKYF